MGPGVGAQGGLGDDDDIQRLLAFLVAQRRLVDPGLEVPLHRGLFEVVRREARVIDLAALLAPGPPPGVGASVRAVQRGITPALGTQGPVR
jgi:hypothetical protein